MQITRRKALQLLAAAAPALVPRRGFTQAITAGPFAGTRDSLRAYALPEWFGDAKFGIWSHWGPQSAVGDGDWYARNMYIEGSAQYEYHRQRFGPQSKVGYKDLVPLFTADKWDPDHLMDLYQKAGAKYFFSMGVHHDNYDLWNSKYQPRWNAVASGPHKDVVGLWAAAARKRGLRFGVSEHLSNSFDWFAPSHLADTKGAYAGVPYDGQDPAFRDLYHDYTGEPADFARTAQAMGRNAPDRWKIEYFNRIKDLIDQHQPDLLYTDGDIPFEQYGLGIVAELYNVGALGFRHEPESVYFSKAVSDCAVGTCALDRERGVLDNIAALPWQSDTCIGQWHYKLGEKYKTPKKVIDLLVDIVSKNGNLLLNIPLPASGVPDAEELDVLEGITHWMSINGEGIFGTRPWKINGEGPSMSVVIQSNGKEFDPNEGKKPDLTAKDIRFTTRGHCLYAFVQGWPASEVVVESLASGRGEKAVDVRLLGRDEALRFVQDGAGLHVQMPAEKPLAADIGVCLRVNFA
jgi:alpha-L-fucosidase